MTIILLVLLPPPMPGACQCIDGGVSRPRLLQEAALGLGVSAG